MRYHLIHSASPSLGHQFHHCINCKIYNIYNIVASCNGQMFLVSQMQGSCLHIMVCTLLLLLLEHTFPILTRLSAITLCFISFNFSVSSHPTTPCLNSKVALIRSGNWYGGNIYVVERRKYKIFFTCCGLRGSSEKYHLIRWVSIFSWRGDTQSRCEE